jgi:glycyl-tRNA synthetase beta chain
LPETLEGAIISIADKIDTICGCFSVGLIPTGTSDPYALRRQGIGILQIILDRGFTFSLTELIEKSLACFKPKNLSEVKEQVSTFLQNRVTNLFVDRGYSRDTVAAVLSASADIIPESRDKVEALESLKAKPDFEPLAVAFKRVVNIIRKAGYNQKVDVDQNLFEHASEQALLTAYESVSSSVEEDLTKGGFNAALIKIASLRDPIDAFFEGVMVMADDNAVRQNRLALLGNIAALFGEFADFSKLST